LQTKVLAKFGDTTCILVHALSSYSLLNNSGVAGGSEKELRAMETCEKQKVAPISLRLFLLINRVDLKNKYRNYRKPLVILSVRE